MPKWKKLQKPLIIAILALLAVAYYFYLSNRDVNRSGKEKETSVATSLSNRDLDKNYPGTPRGVVDFYSQLTKVWYKESLTEDELGNLAQKARALFDQELLDKNPNDQYVLNLKADIKAFQDKDKYISDYTVEDASNIDYVTFQKQSYAKVDTVYYVRENGQVTNTYQQYTLRKDKDGKWKILFWTVSDASALGK